MRDNRDVIALDLDALIDSGAQMVSLEGFENYVSVCLLQHAGKLDQLALRLQCSAVEAIEFNFADVHTHVVRQGWARGMGSSRQLPAVLSTLCAALEGKWNMQCLVDGQREDGVNPNANSYVFIRLTDKFQRKHPTVEAA